MNQENELLEKVKGQVAQEQNWIGSPPWNRYPKEFEIIADRVAIHYAKEFVKSELEMIKESLERDKILCFSPYDEKYKGGLQTGIELINKRIEEI